MSTISKILGIKEGFLNTDDGESTTVLFDQVEIKQVKHRAHQFHGDPIVTEGAFNFVFSAKGNNTSYPMTVTKEVAEQIAKAVSEARPPTDLDKL